MGDSTPQWAFDVNLTSIWHQTLMSKLRHEIGQKWKSFWRQSVDVNLMLRFWPLLMSFWCYFDVMLCWHLMSILHLFDVRMSWCWCHFNAILISFNIKLRYQFNINVTSNIFWHIFDITNLLTYFDISMSSITQFQPKCTMTDNIHILWDLICFYFIFL